MKIDFLIAGQGLAGSLLADALQKAGATIRIVDPEREITSSSVAAGILHPITGRRIVKTWMADQLIPSAIEKYRSIDPQLFTSKPILEIFTSIQQQNEWMNKSADENMKLWMGSSIHPDQNISGVQLPHGGISITNTGWLDVRLLMEKYKNTFNSQGVFIKDEIKESTLIFENNEVKWNDFTASAIIFCNGWRAAHNTSFSYLPFVPAKGEIMEIYCEGLNENFILNRGIYIIPTGNHYFKVGATFNWDDLTEAPTENGRSFLTNALEKIVNLPYSVTWHAAAVRPANKDRRPFIGMHHQHKQLGIFNGLGTKGAMMAPYFAQHFTDYLLHGKELIREVSIERFL